MNLQIRRRPRVDDGHLPEALHPLLRQIYASRGVDGPHLLERSAQFLLPPQRLSGMAQAVALLTHALSQQKKILIVGDFDCDGATSTALCMLALRAMGGQKVDYLIPNRFEFGYGLTPEIVALAKQRGAELILTVDNGISSLTGVAAAKAMGMEVLISDHHLPGAQLPQADAIVNPNQQGCDFPSKSLAGVGVAFYLMAALNSHLKAQHWYGQQGLTVPNIADYLDLVALGTVADVVVLDGNNRILVHQGLQRIRAGHCRAGIKALIEMAGRNSARLTAADLGFSLGPRLNAVGRLDDMTLGVECLLCDNLEHARQLAQQMDSLNQERKEIEQGMQQEALASLAQLRFQEGAVPAGIVLHRDDWHQGVVGLVASKVKERYYRPVIAFAQSSDSELKGSGRSIAGVHLRDALELLDSRYPNMMGKFGGHAMAAGLTLPKANIETFRQAFESVISELVTPEILTDVLLTDGELLADELTLEFAELLRAAGPWGQGFPEPLFDGEFTLIQQRLVGDKHLKMMVCTQTGLALDAIAFGVDVKRWPDASVQRVRLVYRLDVNEWRGHRSVQLLVEHLQALA